MTVNDILEAIAADVREHELELSIRKAEQRGARAHQREESVAGREALERIARVELRGRAQAGRFQLRGGAR